MRARFVVDVTPFVSAGENLVAVEADNRHDPDMPPLSADFTFFGGIYRDVSLLLTHKVHIAPTDMGSSGVCLSTPRVSVQSAEVDVRTLVANRSDRTARLRVEHRIFAPDGSEAARAGCPLVVEPGQVAEPVCRGIRIADPQLWDLDAPNLYRVLTRIVAEDGSGLDCVSRDSSSTGGPASSSALAATRTTRAGAGRSPMPCTSATSAF